MKTAKYITLFLFTVFITGCRIDSAEDIDGQRTKLGAVAFEELSGMLYNNVQPVTLAQVVDLYLTAPTESERENIQKVYLPNYKVAVNGNECTLTGDLVWTFDTKGRRLRDPDAEWSVECNSRHSYNYVSIPEGGYTIRKEDGPRWSLTITEQIVGARKAVAALTIEYLQANAETVTPTSGFSLTGEGKVISKGDFTIAYNVELGLICVPARFIPINEQSRALTKTSYTPPYIRSQFVDGKVNMELEKGSPVQKTAIQADLSQSTGQYPFVVISMGGYKESWMVFSEIYY